MLKIDTMNTRNSKATCQSLGVLKCKSIIMASQGFNGYTRSFEDIMLDIEFTHSFNPMYIRKVKPGHLSSIAQQRRFAESKFLNVQRQLANAPTSKFRKRLEDDVWAWGIFASTVLPMLSFLDD